MCGICGEFRFDNNPVDINNIIKMSESMSNRGPDANGIFSQGPVAFGHRRLKIIDLSECSQQPMVDAQLGLSIVFNGAIYNYPDLRDELIQKGYTFFSKGDTEVILKAYHAWGLEFVKKLNGMFAFAIWERDSGRLILGRDRLGIKPLYFTSNKNWFRFASTLPALLQTDNLNTSINPEALHHYMTFHAVVPAPHTILNDIKKVEPATVIKIELDGKQSSFSYWEPRFERREYDKNISFEEWQEMVLNSLRRAVKRRLIADVPVGVLLSGGLDSSLIVGLLAEAGQKNLNTFSVGFESVGKEKGNEFQYSDIIAEHFQTEHHKIQVPNSEMLEMLEVTVAAMSEPMVSHDAVGFFTLSREVAKSIKVVQSGQGADEVFAGYHWYPPLMKSTDPVKDYASYFFDRTHAEYGEAINQQLVERDFSLQFVQNHFQKNGAEEPIDKALRLDTTVMLIDDPVKRVDNMTMAWGLEARVPFLDHELVELAASIPGKFKVENDGKYVLKEAARRVIPHEVIDRPKGYFPVPALKYIQGNVLEFVKNILNQPVAKQRNIFRRKYIDKLLEDPESHITPLRGSKLWQITLLEYWLQKHHIQ
jgi:asparagine synthase (glutamine-hydrolysing)